MNGPRPLCVLAFCVMLTGIVPGCAVYTTYRKCGIGGCLGDAAITTEVLARFAMHPALEPPTLLNVQTLDRVVYLSGLVNTDMERQMAESVALEAPAVARVVNSIGIEYQGQ